MRVIKNFQLRVLTNFEQQLYEIGHLNPEYAIENLFRTTITVKYNTPLDFEASS